MPDTNMWTCPHCGCQNATPFCANCGLACPITGVAFDQTQPPIQQPYLQPTYGQNGAPGQNYQQPYQQPYAQQPPVQPGQPYYQQPGTQPFDQQQAYGQPYQQPMPTYYEPAPAYAQPASAIPGWKTSVLFSILGCIASGLMNGIVGGFTETGGMWFSIVYCAVTLYYCLAIYPTYFSGNPKLSDSNIISFANFFFGGIIFGCLWNHNITRGEKGISSIVYAVLSSLSILILIAGLAVL